MTDPINLRLKRLRESAVPRLSIRAMADALDIGHSRYAYFEDPKRFKRAALPLELTRKIAAVLGERGVPYADVMKLAGLVGDEAGPEAEAIEAQRPSTLYVAMPVAFPSEAALTEMLTSLLAIVPKEASRAEAAKILARQLPAAFAGIALHSTVQIEALAPPISIPAPGAATDYPEP